MAKTAASKVSAVKHKYTIELGKPGQDGVCEGAELEKFLHDSIKVEGKPGQLGDKIKIVREGNVKITVSSNIPFSKRYLKYLTKKFLKKNGLRDWIRVVAVSFDSYQLIFYNISGVNDDEEED